MAGYSGGAPVSPGPVKGSQGPTPTGPPRSQPKSSRPAPVQVKAHTRAAPSSKPSKPNRGAAPQSNPLLDPNQALSGQSLLNAAKALSNTQTQGPLTELQKQIAADNAQTRGTINLTGGYYNQLEPFVQQGVTNSGNIASGLNSQLQGIGADTQSQLAGLGQSGLANIAKYAPAGDGSTSSAAASDLAAQIARLQGLAAQQAGTYRSFGATQGANYQGAANANLGAFGLQGQEALRGIAQSGTVKNQPLVSKIADLRASQGSLTATDLGKLRQQEVSNQIARAGVGINQARVAATVRGQNITAANDQTRNQIAAANNQANQALRRAGLSEKQQNDLSNQALKAAQLNEKTNNDAQSQALRQAALNLKAATSGGKGGGRPLTQNEQNTIYRNLDEMSNLIQAARKQGESAQTIKSALENGQIQKGFPAQSSVLVEAAYELMGWGHVLPQTALAMRAMGLRGGTHGGRPIKVGPAPKAQPNPLVPGTQNPLAPGSTGLA